MKILALMGSPRKEGNTDILVDKVINGAQAGAGHQTEKLHLYDLNLLPCIDCRNCSSGEKGLQQGLRHAGYLQQVGKLYFNLKSPSCN